MSELISAAAESYALERTTPFDGALGAAAAWTQDNTSSPQMMSGLAEARLLETLIVVGGAQRVLEVGTFTGVGTLSMAAALADGGRVTTWRSTRTTPRSRAATSMPARSRTGSN